MVQRRGEHGATFPRDPPPAYPLRRLAAFTIPRFRAFLT